MTGIVVASFGTSYSETRAKCIEPIEALVRERYGAERVVRAFTSNMVRRILKERDGIDICSPQEAIEMLRAQGCDDVVLMSLHLLDGFEYEKLTALSERVTRPLLDTDEDFARLAADPKLNDRKDCDAIVFMGHGSEHEVADRSYYRMQEAYQRAGQDRIFVGTVEGSLTFDCILEQLGKQRDEKNIQRILLKPFMLVAGDHALNDMASDEEDSWKSLLEADGYEVVTDVRGMGELASIREMFCEKLAAAMETAKS